MSKERFLMTAPKAGQPTLAELGEEGQADCRAIIQILDRVGDKWAIMVIGALANGPVRFNAMLRAIIGISHRMLTLTLRGLQRDGLVVRRAFPTIPPKVEYELTPLGRSLIDPLWNLVGWVQANQVAIVTARAEFDSQKEE
jgi:DNA-binding HxlR family transcriptional regulator